MDYHSLVEKTTTLRGRLTRKMGSKDVGDEVSIQTPTSTLSLSGLKERLNGLMRSTSTDEVGWALQSVDAPVQDETEQFYTIFEGLKTDYACTEQMSHYSYLLVPGLFCNSYPTYFREILAYFKDVLNVTCEFAHINTKGSVKSNAKHVKEIVEAQYEQFNKKPVVMLGHSKGGTDAAAACAMFWSELKDKVGGLIMLQALYGGTPLAADLLSGSQFGALNSIFLGKLTSFSNPDGTVDAVRDLTYKNRRSFLDEYPFPRDVPTLCFHSNLPPDSNERFKKYMMKEGFLKGRLAVPLEMQLGRQLALMSKYILARYPGVESDGLVTRKDAEVPGAVVVRFKEDLAHTLVIPEDPANNANSTNVQQQAQGDDEPAQDDADADAVPAPLNASFVCQTCVMLLLSTRK